MQLTAEQLAATKKALTYYQELLPLCHHPDNVRDVKRQIQFLTDLIARP